MPTTEVIQNHPYLKKCFLTNKPLPIELSDIQGGKIDCSLFANGCKAWFASGGRVIQERKIIDKGILYRLSQVVTYSPGPTAPSNYFLFKPLTDSTAPDFYYSDLTMCTDAAEIPPRVARPPRQVSNFYSMA